MAKGSDAVGSNLTEGPILRTLLTFAIPIILTNLIQQLYSVVDLIVIGRFVGNIGTVGVSTGSELADMLTPVASGFASAGQIYIAQLAGAKDNQRIKDAVGTLCSMMLLISFAAEVVIIAFHVPILHVMNCPEEAFSQASQYLIITAAGLPFIFGYNAICGILRGMGESKRPMYFVLVAATVNIFADLLLVAVIPLEAAGTAIATVLSQIGSFLAAFLYMYKQRTHFDFEVKRSFFRIRREPLWIMIKLGIPQIVKSLCVRFSMLWVNANVNAYGLVASATNSVGNKIQKFCEVFVSGVDTAAAAMVGQNLGARKPERAKATIWATVASALCAAVVASILCVSFPKAVFGIFTQDPDVLDFGVVYLNIIWIQFVMSAITGSFQAMVTGSGFVTLGFALGILDGVVCRIGFSVLFANVLGLGVVGYFWGTALSRTLPGVLNFLYFISGRWKTRKLLSESKHS